MTKPISLKQAAKYYKSLPHQDKAWDYLQETAPEKIIDKFGEIYRTEIKEKVQTTPQETGERAFVAQVIQRIKDLGIELDKPDAYANDNDHCINIIGLEGINPDFSLNDDKPNQFNDLILILGVTKQGKFKYFQKSIATTEPGSTYTYSPMNPNGAARVIIDTKHEKIWQIGHHGSGRSRHEALVQTGNKVCVARDYNKDFSRDGDKIQCGFFGINLHGGYNMPTNNIGRASAGCPVIRSMDEIQSAVNLCKSDYFYKKNSAHRFSFILLDGGKIFGDRSTAHAVVKAPASDNTEKLAIDLIVKWECGGNVDKYLEAYADPAHGWSVPTIGIGTIRYPNGTLVRRGDKITKEQAYKYCQNFIQEHLYPNLRKIPLWDTMAPEMRAAIISFAYNLGAFYGANGFNTLTSRLRDRHWTGVADAIKLYNKAGGKTLPGLVARRQDEASLWEKGLKKL